MIKRIYIVVLQQTGRLLDALGLFDALDRLRPRSRFTTWFRSLFAIHDLDRLQSLDVPWWTFESADLVAQHLADRPAAKVFEWGSGASTLWLAKRAQSVHSVEHDPGWAAHLRGVLPANARLQLVPAVRSDSPVIGSAKAGHRDLDFSDYVAAIEQTGTIFDLIVIDGRAREACLVHAMRHLANDGLVVFDNVDRRRYRDAIAQLGDGARTYVSRGLTPALPYPTRTALLRRAG